MSLKKWKAWPVKNSEDVLKNWQKACDHENRILWPVFGQNKIFWTQQSWISILSTYLVAGLFMFQVPDVSSDVNSRNMIRNMAEISTRKHSHNGALYVLL